MAQDDYYYEIQLTNKQLIFSFLAGATGLVLSFLAGVMVGRGVDASEPAVQPLREEKVRELALSYGLESAKRPESQEICFIQEKNYAKFNQRFHAVQMEPGQIVDLQGNTIGTA